MIIAKLVSFEGMRVREVFPNDPGKHYQVEAIPNRMALERLALLNLDDQTRISRLRFMGAARLYGFLLDNVFHVVWWDPNHQVWPVEKRNT